MNKRDKKEGISLIVLIITIIVMLILATVIVMSLSKNNVIDKANTAVNETNLKNMEEAANTALGEVLLGQNKTMTDEEYKQAIISKMEENGIDTTGYTISYNSTTGKVSVAKSTSGNVSKDWAVAILQGQADDGGDLYAFAYIGSGTSVTLPCNTSLLVNVVEYDEDTETLVPTDETLTLNIGTDYSTINGFQSMLAFMNNDTITSITIPDGMNSLLSGENGSIFSICSNLQQINLPSRSYNNRR